MPIGEQNLAKQDEMNAAEEEKQQAASRKERMNRTRRRLKLQDLVRAADKARKESMDAIAAHQVWAREKTRQHQTREDKKKHNKNLRLKNLRQDKRFEWLLCPPPPPHPPLTLSFQSVSHSKFLPRQDLHSLSFYWFIFSCLLFLVCFIYFCLFHVFCLFRVAVFGFCFLCLFLSLQIVSHR